MAAKRKAGKRSFGSIYRERRVDTAGKVILGRYRARYVGPDSKRHAAPTTFEDKNTALIWLATEQRLCEDQESWEPPKVRAARAQTRLTLASYSTTWLAHRTLKTRTREGYQRLLDAHLLPAFGALPLVQITTESVNVWHTGMGTATPTLRSHAYGLLRTMLGDAERDALIPRNPCHIRGAGNVKRVKRIRPASLDELEALVLAMPERFKAMTLLAAWCGLRFGELAELRRKDLDLQHGVIRVRRAVVRAHGGTEVTTPKSDAGIRDVAIPPHLLPTVKAHVNEHAAWGREGLLFPGAAGGHLAPSSLYGRSPTQSRAGWGFYAAREAAGRPDLRWHDLRHTGAVLAASTGATLAELMARLGHSTPAAALRYQHAAEGRDAVIAGLLSELAAGASHRR